MTTVFYFYLAVLVFTIIMAAVDSAVQEFFAGLFIVLAEYGVITGIMAVCFNLVSSESTEKAAYMTLTIIAVIAIYAFACLITDSFGWYMMACAAGEALKNILVMAALAAYPLLLIIGGGIWMLRQIAAL